MFFFAKTKHCANCVREFGQQFSWGKRQRSGRGYVCLHVMIVRFSNSLFLSQHCAVLCLFFYFRGSLIGTTNLLSLYLNRIKKFFFSCCFFENKFGIFFLSRATSIFVKSVCMFVIGSNVNTADCLIFVFAFF